MNWPECLVRHTHQPTTWLEDPATQKTGIRLHPCEPIRPTIHHLPANRTRPTPTHSPTHTHRSTPAPRKCGLRALVPLTNQPALSFSLAFSISFAFRQNISIFPGTFRRCPKAKSRAKSYAHASADSFFLLFFFSRRLFVAGHPIFVRLRHFVLLLRAAFSFCSLLALRSDGHIGTHTFRYGRFPARP